MKFFEILKWLLLFNLVLILLNVIGASAFVESYAEVSSDDIFKEIAISSMAIGVVAAVFGALLYGVQGALQLAIIGALGTGYTALVNFNFTIFNSIFIKGSPVQLLWGIIGLAVALAGIAGIAQLASQGWKSYK